VQRRAGGARRRGRPRARGSPDVSGRPPDFGEAARESRSWKSCSAPTHQRRRSEAAAPRAARADRRFAAEALVAFAAPLRAAVSPARADRARADRRRFPLRSGGPGASYGAGQRAAVAGDAAQRAGGCAAVGSGAGPAARPARGVAEAGVRRSLPHRRGSAAPRRGRIGQDLVGVQRRAAASRQPLSAGRRSSTRRRGALGRARPEGPRSARGRGTGGRRGAPQGSGCASALPRPETPADARGGRGGRGASGARRRGTLARGAAAAGGLAAAARAIDSGAATERLARWAAASQRLGVAEAATA